MATLITTYKVNSKDETVTTSFSTIYRLGVEDSKAGILPVYANDKEYMAGFKSTALYAISRALPVEIAETLGDKILNTGNSKPEFLGNFTERRQLHETYGIGNGLSTRMLNDKRFNSLDTNKWADGYKNDIGYAMA
jgi:hypothetical protein